MKYFLLSALLYSLLSADWSSDLLNESNKIYNKIKIKTLDTYQQINQKESEKDTKLEEDKLKKEKFNKIWSDIFDDLQSGAILAEKQIDAPSSAIFGTDKSDIQKDINKILNDIVNILIDDDLLTYRKKIEDLNNKILENKSDILTYREKRIGAPDDSTIYTTKKDYDKKIYDKKNEINILNNEIRIIKNKLNNNFKTIGVNLTPEQINVLLSRVDGNDIIQITLVMNVLKQITNEIMVLMKQSNEELSQAKKYYAMHIIILELIVYVEQQYIDRINNIYLSKIYKIESSANDMIDKTNDLISQEVDNRRREIYNSNLETQKLTIKVINLYRQDLESSRDSIKNAQTIAISNLKLAKNTFETVSLSANLYKLVSDSQDIFNKISKIQVPKIVPFENIQIQKKYEELTKILQKK